LAPARSAVPGVATFTVPASAPLGPDPLVASPVTLTAQALPARSTVGSTMATAGLLVPTPAAVTVSSMPLPGAGPQNGAEAGPRHGDGLSLLPGSAAVATGPASPLAASVNLRKTAALPADTDPAGPRAADAADLWPAAAKPRAATQREAVPLQALPQFSGADSPATAPQLRAHTARAVPWFAAAPDVIAARTPDAEPGALADMVAGPEDPALLLSGPGEARPGPPAAPHTTLQAPAAPPAAQQVATALHQAMRDGQIEIQLSPEELGRVRMTLTPQDGAMVVTILADRDDTLSLLRRHVDQLGAELRDLGFQTLDFRFGQNHGRGPGNQTTAPASITSPAQAAAAESPQSAPRPTPAGTTRVDIRL
jgi:hypothetical protein